MAYTPEQNAQIIKSFWESGGSARCPVDNARLDVRRTSVGPAYLLIGQCPKCGQYVKAGSDDDPKKSEFRQWTDEELVKMADGYFENRYANCPVCQIWVDTREIRNPMGPSSLIFHCKRCGQHQTYHPKQPKQVA
jgi:hypothetical protein